MRDRGKKNRVEKIKRKIEKRAITNQKIIVEIKSPLNLLNIPRLKEVIKNMG